MIYIPVNQTSIPICFEATFCPTLSQTDAFLCHLPLGMQDNGSIGAGEWFIDELSLG
jgi:hypothetical protein